MGDRARIDGRILPLPRSVIGHRPIARAGFHKALAILLGLALGAGFCLFVTVIEWGAWSLVMPGRKWPEKSAGQPIQATAADGTRLAGSWFPAEGSTGRTLLLLHGLAEDGSALLGRVPPMVRRGWNVAVLDSRASGESDGRRASFGGRESDDLRAWIDAITPLAGADPAFAAWGRSMGASIALKAAASDPRLAALVLEAPYRDLASAVALVLGRLKIPAPSLMARLVLLRARSLAGVALDRPRPVDLAPLVPVPTLILHGLEDPIAPVAAARDLANAFHKAAEIVEVPGAGHANVVGIGGDSLMDRVGDFLDAAVPE